MRISEWPLAERPRERLLAKGAAALSDAELVAVLLRSGVRGKSAVDLARELLTRNLKEALSLIEVKVLDHFIVAGHQAISFAERGLL